MSTASPRGESASARLNLEQQKKRAKELLKAVRAGEADAVRRVRAEHPQRHGKPAAKVDPAGVTLSDAQLVVAREAGFESWPKLKRAIELAAEARAGAAAGGKPATPRPVPPPADPKAFEKGKQAFTDAVRSGDPERLRTLFSREPWLAGLVDEPWFGFDAPAVVEAADRPEMLDVLLEHGADVNAKSKWWAGGFGALHAGSPDRLETFLARGATLDVHAAARFDKLDELRAMIEADPALVNAPGGDGQTPLHFARTVRVAEYLLDHGAAIDARDVDHGSTPAQYMAMDRPDVCRYLIGRGAEPDIFMACALGDLAMVKRMLAEDPAALDARVGKGAFTSGESKGGHIYEYTLHARGNPLFFAAETGNRRLLSLLMSRVSPKERFLVACWAANAGAAKRALKEQPNLVEQLGPEDRRLIADAAWAGRTAAVRLMLRLGWDVEARGGEESTALNRAATRGYAELIDLLVRHGADVESKNVYGGTCLGACLWGSIHFRDRRGDYPASVEKLLKAGAKLHDDWSGSEAVNEVLARWRSGAAAGGGTRAGTR